MLCIKQLSNFTKTKSFGCVRWASSVKREFKEVSIKVPWGFVAGKWWEPYDTRPILTIHGWQDSCQSFDRLIPILNKNVGFLAIDLPGHGYSSRLPDGMFYHYTTYILTIKSILKNFNWSKISLMGHSYGSLLSYIYSMYFPAETDFLICLEGMKPMIVPDMQADLSSSFDDFFKYDNFVKDSKEPPSYTIEELKILLAQPNNNSIFPEFTTYIMERNIAPSKVYPGKYFLTRDPRIKTSLMIHFCQNELLQLAENMKMPIFIIKATEFHYYEPKKNFYEVLDILKRTSVDCDFHYVEGRHHVHLNNPEKVAGLLNNFICKHHKEDKGSSGFNDDIVVKNVTKSIFF